MARVYVSSTFRDLQSCRAAVRRALQRLDQVDVAMETQVADQGRPLDRCLAGVARCDLYLGIFAWRYGHVPAGQDLSITELEYREALRLGKPVLVFLLDEDAPWPRSLMDIGEGAARIERLRADLQERHTCCRFSDPASLASEVSATVARWLTEHRLSPAASSPAGSEAAVSTRAAGSGYPAPAYVPVLGRITAGDPNLADQVIEDVFPLPRELVGKGTLFLLRVVGESMIGAAICDGDWVVVRQQPDADHGNVVAARIDDEATVKTLRRSGGRVWLHPENPPSPTSRPTTRPSSAASSPSCAVSDPTDGPFPWPGPLTPRGGDSGGIMVTPTSGTVLLPTGSSCADFPAPPATGAFKRCLRCVTADRR